MDEFCEHWGSNMQRNEPLKTMKIRLIIGIRRKYCLQIAVKRGSCLACHFSRSFSMTSTFSHAKHPPAKTQSEITQVAEKHKARLELAGKKKKRERES